MKTEKSKINIIREKKRKRVQEFANIVGVSTSNVRKIYEEQQQKKKTERASSNIEKFIERYAKYFFRDFLQTGKTIAKRSRSKTKLVAIERKESVKNVPINRLYRHDGQHNPKNNFPLSKQSRQMKRIDGKKKENSFGKRISRYQSLIATNEHSNGITRPTRTPGRSPTPPEHSP